MITINYSRADALVLAMATLIAGTDQDMVQTFVDKKSRDHLADEVGRASFEAYKKVALPEGPKCVFRAAACLGNGMNELLRIYGFNEKNRAEFWRVFIDALTTVATSVEGPKR